MVLLNIELKFRGLFLGTKEILLIVGELLPFDSNRLLKVQIASIPKEHMGAYIILRNYGILTNLVDDLMMVLEKLKHRRKW